MRGDGTQQGSDKESNFPGYLEAQLDGMLAEGSAEPAHASAAPGEELEPADDADSSEGGVADAAAAVKIQALARGGRDRRRATKVGDAAKRRIRTEF